MGELKVLLLMGATAFLAALLYRLLADEEERSLPMLIVWMLIPLAAVLTKNIFVVFALVIVIKLFVLRNDVRTNVAYFIFLFPALPEAYAVEFWEKGNLHVANLNLQFVLSLFLLVPLIPKVWASRREAVDGKDEAVERRRSMLGWAFPVFLALLYFGTFRERYEFPVTVYSAIREVFTFTLTIAVPYYLITRTIDRLEDFEVYLKALVLSGLFLALSSYVEEAFRWKLYHQLGLYMNTFMEGSIETLYEFRGPILRVAGSLTHPITFGFYLTIVLGAVLYLARVKKVSAIVSLLFITVFAGAIFLTVSRGAMLGLALFVMVWMVYRLPVMARRFVTVFVVLAGATYLLLSNVSIGQFEAKESENAIEDLRTFDYRMELAKNSLQVIPRQFWFGSRTYKGEPEMQKLKQGQGIVDMVNGYIHITMDYGVIGLLAFLALQLRALGTANRWVRVGEDLGISEYKMLGAVLVAVLLSIYVQFASTSFDGPIISYFFLTFALVLGTRRILDKIQAQAEQHDADRESLMTPFARSAVRG